MDSYINKILAIKMMLHFKIFHLNIFLTQIIFNLFCLLQEKIEISQRIRDRYCHYNFKIQKIINLYNKIIMTLIH